MPLLFEPLTLRGTTLRNRIVVSPMCEYSAVDGVPNDWHLVHLGSRAVGGAALVLTEAAAVSSEGRISPQDAGIWSDEQEKAWSRITAFVTSQGAAVGVQLAHAGRKASTYRPWDPRGGTVPAGDGGWQAVAPSALAFGRYAVPAELDHDGIDKVVADFVAATRRAERAGFDVVELHGAHGYLLHTFCSPLSNHRTDEYGGDFANRVRLPLRVVEAVRAVWPTDKPLLYRVSASDWVEGGWTSQDTVELSVLLRERGGGPRGLLLGRAGPGPADHDRPRLPGAFRGGRPLGCGYPHRRCRHDHVTGAGRGGPGRRRCRRRAACPRAAPRPLLAPARRRRARS